MLTLHVGIPLHLAEGVALQQFQKIEQQTSSSISFGAARKSDQISDTDAREMFVAGDNALAAVGAILQSCTELDTSLADNCVLYVYVSAEHVGCVIGKGGCQISGIRAMNPGARFTMDKHPQARAIEGDVTVQAEDGQKERTMAIVGTMENASNGLLDIGRIIQDSVLGHHADTRYNAHAGPPEYKLQNPPRNTALAESYHPDTRPAKRMRQETEICYQQMPANFPIRRQKLPPPQLSDQRRPKQMIEVIPEAGVTPFEGELALTIPSEAAGLLIGRGGSTITQMRKSSGCKIEIDKHPQTNTSVRNIYVRGGLLELENCLRTIREHLEAPDTR